MPLIKSDTDAATQKNFHDFRLGKTFHKTASKFGKKKAIAQMDAAVLKNKRKAAGKKY
jgi:hypothetical protein